MRFSLQDVKKQIHRRGGELSVSLHFLQSRAGTVGAGLAPARPYSAEIDCLIAYHERFLHQPQRQFPDEEARACIGDYRLAHCLICTLSAWYSRQLPRWDEVVQSYGEETHLSFEAAGITSPVQLRLALYNYVNEYHAGFLDFQTRAAALETFAGVYDLTVPQLEYLLVLDSEDEALLVRTTPEPPQADEVVALYNQWVFEAALFNASDVHFVIDCNAFMKTQHAEGGNDSIGAGIGAVIKRLCYLARKLGVYYDLSYDTSTLQEEQWQGRAGQAQGTVPTYQALPLLHLTLYGPQEMTGAAQQYGLRLARLCRVLLGYGKKNVGAQFIAPQERKGQRQNILPSQAIREAEATVHFLQRSYRFVMDTDLLNLLPTAHQTMEGASRTGTSLGGQARVPTFHASTSFHSDTSTLFDSSIEQSFAEAFQALENSSATEGWRLEREPEPLLLDTSIFIPDFALTRGKRRIYVEILGFWTPSYRERKIAKLQQLQGRDDLVLAIPVEAREAFASIASAFPIVAYDNQLSATELLNTLRSRYDDFEERLAFIDSVAVRMRVMDEGLLPERACYDLLHCYRRSELQQAAERIVNDEISFTPGIGLYSTTWMEHLRRSFVEQVGAPSGDEVEARLNAFAPPGEKRELPLADALREIKMRWPILANCDDSTLEALLSLWPEVQVRRDSIFDAVVEIMHNVGPDLSRPSPIYRPVGTPNELSPGTTSGRGQASSGRGQAIAPTVKETPLKPAPKKQVRERRSNYKKRTTIETTQGDLWG